jgi:small-conductance mechanosensitive channel
MLAIPMVVSADIYRWTNERGVVSFTDNLGNIPPKYRAKAVLVDAPVPTVQEVVIDQGGSKAKAGADEAADRKDAGEEQKKKKLIGGKDEATWKRESERINFEVSDTEKQIAEMRDRLTDTSKMSRTEYLSLQNSLRLLEQRLETQKAKRETFLDTARKAGAPL